MLTRTPSPMMKAVLKTLAISFGGGLAIGAGIRLTQGASKPRRESEIDLIAKKVADILGKNEIEKVQAFSSNRELSSKRNGE